MGISVMAKQVDTPLELWFGLFLFVFGDELCSGRNVTKRRKGLAGVMLLIAVPVGRSACLGRWQHGGPGSARDMSSPSGEHRPWRGTAGTATDVLAAALRALKATGGCKTMGT